jgi:IS5 family transposase
MERKSAQPTFMDALTSDLGGPRTSAFLERCAQAIPWQQLADSISDLFPKLEPAPGRPHWPLVLMIKCVMLQKWYGLSDPQLEENLQDRLSFRRFVGLSVLDATPDETTFVVFRRRLRESGHAQTLFETTNAYLREQNLMVQEGTLVDAHIIEVSMGGRREDGSSTRDPLATKTYKNGRTYHGYKAHVATDRRGLITNYVYDTASSSDHTHADQLMAQETKAVYADSAYRSAKRAEALRARGVFCGIAYQRVKGQKELRPEQKAHNRHVAPIRAFVEHPFAWMRKMNFWRARYRGMVRNAFDFAMRAIAYNWKRSLSLTPITS